MVKKIIKYFLSTTLLSLTLVCCNNKTEEVENGGAIVLSLNTDSTYIVLTKAEETVLTPADFRVRIENTKGEIRKQWDSYSNVENPIIASAGSYQLIAWHGDKAALPNFDTPYYEGSAKFAVVEGQTTKADLTCSMAATKVSLRFDDNFGDDYSSYSVSVATNQGGSSVFDKWLTFTPADQQRPAYFVAGHLRLRFSLVRRSDGQTITWFADAGVTTKVQEWYKLNLKVTSNAGSASISITTDEGTNTPIDIDVDIPNMMMPKPAPSYSANGFELGAALNTTEGVSKTASLGVTAKAGVKSLIISTETPELLAQGWPAGDVELVGISGENKAALQNLGMQWDQRLENPELVQVNLTVRMYITFTNVIKHLKANVGEPTIRTFEVSTIDMFDQRQTTTVSIYVGNPIFNIVNIAPAQVWTQQAEIDINYKSDLDTYRPTLLVSANGGAWHSTTAEILNDESGKITYLIRGLTADSPYRVKAQMGQHIEGDNMVESFTTERAAQIANSNFDSWTSEEKTHTWALVPYKYTVWYPGNWATRNPASTSISSGYGNGYCINNGTFPVDNASGKAVELLTTAWAGGNTSTAGSGGTKKNITAGLLFLGSYSFTKDGETMNGETITQGVPFSSRPLAISFDHKYAPLSNDKWFVRVVVENHNASDGTVTVLGSANYYQADAIEAFTRVSVPIEYNVEYSRALCATHISIMFSSSAAEWPERPATVNSGTGTLHYGSRLTVDNMELNY